MTYSYFTSDTFTKTHAVYLASKVAADLKQMQLFYGKPSDESIEAYINEIVLLLVNKCLQDGRIRIQERRRLGSGCPIHGSVRWDFGSGRPVWKGSGRREYFRRLVALQEWPSLRSVVKVVGWREDYLLKVLRG